MIHEFTNKEWRDLLIEGWKRDMPIHMIIRHAAKLTNDSTHDDMEQAIAHAKTRSPAPGRVDVPVRAFFATKATNASDAAWSGNMKKAREALKSAIAGPVSNRARERREYAKEVKTTKFISLRNLDDASNWKKCK